VITSISGTVCHP